jgi:anti-sigma factor RsiW
MHNERMAGGLRCSEVLALLSEFADGELEAPVVEQIRAHVTECPNCLRFGGSFQKMLEAIAGERSAPEPPAAALQRLSVRLVDALGKE